MKYHELAKLYKDANNRSPKRLKRLKHSLAVLKLRALGLDTSNKFIAGGYVGDPDKPLFVRGIDWGLPEPVKNSWDEIKDRLNAGEISFPEDFGIPKEMSEVEPRTHIEIPWHGMRRYGR